MIIHRHVDVPGATIHCVIAGEGEPVLLLHQTPRSWDEYRDVLPLLAAHGQAIALDTPGFGASSALAAGEDSIERWADAIDLLNHAIRLESNEYRFHYALAQALYSSGHPEVARTSLERARDLAPANWTEEPLLLPDGSPAEP